MIFEFLGTSLLFTKFECGVRFMGIKEKSNVLEVKTDFLVQTEMFQTNDWMISLFLI